MSSCVLFNTTHKKKLSSGTELSLIPSQTIATFQRNSIAILLGATCCARLATLWQGCWFKFEDCKIFMQRLWMLYDSVLIGQVPTSFPGLFSFPTFKGKALGTRLVRFVKQCCARTSALVRFATPNMPKLVATGPPNARNMLRPTKLWYAALKYCDRLAGA